MAVNERLRFARDKAGLTLKQIEARCGIGPSSLSEFEGGKREPRLSQLKALADVYRRPVAFFFEPGSVPSEVVLWRAKPESPKTEEMERKFLQLCEHYRNLETWCGEHTPSELPVPHASAEHFGYADAEQLAIEIRNRLQLGDRPGPVLLHVLEELCGVKVFHLPFEPHGAAASTYSDNFGNAVLLNTNNVRWRRNFDLAHELFHLVTWPVFRSGSEACALEASEFEEKLAGCFASHLLMPAEATRTAVEKVLKDGKITFDGLFDVARQFDVSVEALLWRLKALFNRDREATEGDVQRYRVVASLCDNRELDEPPTRPTRFRTLAIRALKNGHMSIGRFAQYMEITRKEATICAEQEEADDEEIQITSS